MDQAQRFIIPAQEDVRDALAENRPPLIKVFARNLLVTHSTSGIWVIADTLINRVRMAAASSGTFWDRHDRRRHLRHRQRRRQELCRRRQLGCQGRAQPPYGAAVSGLGNLVVADTANSQIQVVMGERGAAHPMR
jgi:hypothetical protein